MYTPSAEEYEAGSLREGFKAKAFAVGAGIGLAAAALSPIAMNFGLIGNLGSSTGILIGSNAAMMGAAMVLWSKMCEKRFKEDATYLKEDGPSKYFEKSVKNLMDNSEMSYNDEDISNLRAAIDNRTKGNNKTLNNDDINLNVSRILKKMDI